MCGIFGFIARADSTFAADQFQPLLSALFLLSESRGKDASGVALMDSAALTVLKRADRARKVVHSTEYHTLLAEFSTTADRADARGFMGHARMVTNGSETRSDNNQPVIKHEMLCLHNGIVVNDTALWSAFPALERIYEVDTEVILSLVRYFRDQGHSLPEAVAETFDQIQGANSIALAANDVRALVLATSNGSLYFARSASGRELVFASEEYILRRAMEHASLREYFAQPVVTQVHPCEGYVFSFDTLEAARFMPGSSTVSPLPTRQPVQGMRNLSIDEPVSAPPKPSPSAAFFSANEQFIDRVNAAVRGLRRCTRCLLPETFPFIDYDGDGVCNYCRRYVSRPASGPDALRQLVEPHRRTDGKPDCLVPLSGGRDSCYSIHYLKNELGLNPVAYTYDWGMVTDLARRNISRMCGALGVEHILVSADIKSKRAHIRRNVNAWLKKPDLGTVPLFMAGDKPFFYYANMLQKQMNLEMVFFSQNHLERTDFKSGFCGIDEGGQKRIYWNLSLGNKFQLMRYYGQRFLENPAYLNRSVIDTMGGFISYYFLPREFTLLFDYLPWDEQLFATTLIRDYDWETANDTGSTWRIGDGTAPFYNYIYYTMAGFTENDTFRSNQIREGLMTREEGLRLAQAENQPRYESLEWYCDTIGVDMVDVLKIINAAPKRYAL